MILKNYLRYFIGIPAFVAGTALTPICANAQTPAMKKAPAAVAVDGTVAEWGDVLAMYDGSSKLHYTIANDDTALFVVIYAADPKLKRKIGMGGVTVSVNTEGKKKKTFSLTYPQPGAMRALLRPSDDGSTPVTYVKLSGFKGMPDNLNSQSNSAGIKAALKFDSDRNLGYEMVIPFKFLALKADKSNELFINISINGIDPAASRGSADNSGQLTHGSVGRSNKRGDASAGSGGPPVGGAGGDDEDMAESQDFWVKLTIAH